MTTFTRSNLTAAVGSLRVFGDMKPTWARSNMATNVNKCECGVSPAPALNLAGQRKTISNVNPQSEETSDQSKGGTSTCDRF